MAFEEKNLVISQTGPSYGSAGGSDKHLYEGQLITSDSAATVEAANWMNNAYPRLPDGGVCLLRAVVGVGGTVKAKNYLMTRSGTTITLALMATTAG